ncbi:MAG: tRNA (adenosine(37)-N6)-threonylcarbamoyltransferase complex dimerization subunit type 1 TsaB [Pseudomonadota bacterium]
MSTSRPIVLAFDTSGPFVRAALQASHAHTHARHEDMARGQAERLPVLCEELLAEAELSWRDIDGIVVCVGPGNFTGIRIAVAFARGLGLALGCDVHGISTFQLINTDLSGRQLCSVAAPAGKCYLQVLRFGVPVTDAVLVTPGEDHKVYDQPAMSVTGHRAEEIAAVRGLLVHPPRTLPYPEDYAALIPQTALRLLGEGKALGPAKPLYVKPADAAPPKDAPPVLID